MAPAPGRIAKRGYKWSAARSWRPSGRAIVGGVERPQMKMSGPVLDTSDVVALTRFYEQLLGWEIEAQEGPRPGYPEADGWSRLRPADGSDKIEIQYEQHYEPPTWPGEPGKPGMQIHLDIWVEDLHAGIEWAQTCGAVQSEKQPDGRDLSRLRVMIDPAGHPFCLWT
jgi:predicted enzyme related to lactoylglutathione lyase